MDKPAMDKRGTVSVADGQAADFSVPSTEGSGVRVFVRLRPPAEESGIEIFECPKNRSGIITIKDPLSAGRSEHTYEFSSIFTPDIDQERIFTPVAAAIVDKALQGNSGCILAYGQTGSGKTYSIFGETLHQQRGLLPRSIERMFAQLQIDSGAITVSFLEVYLDRVRDLGRASLGGHEGEASASPELEDESDDADAATGGPAGGSHRKIGKTSTRASLQPPPTTLETQAAGSAARRQTAAGRMQSTSENLKIREAPGGLVHVKGLTRLPAKDLAEVRRIIDRGLARRATAKTAANIQSSRSHTVFSVYLPKQGDSKVLADGEGAADSVSLSFVDLAGSERLAKSKAEGARFQEAVAINSSLTALGKVVLALASDPDATRHVPYRDSKLTRILSPSLTGGANVSLLATVHPRVEDYEESLNTLSFADRCKNVQRLPQVNYISSKKSSQLRINKISELQQQVIELKEQLRKAQNATAEEMSNCGVSALGPSRTVDEIDLAIAQAIISDGPGTAEAPQQDEEQHEEFVAQGKVQHQPRLTRGGRKGTKKSIAVLMEVQEERGRQARAHEKAEQRMQAFEIERARIAQQEENRLKEAAELSQRGQELEKELKEAQAQMRQTLQQEAQQHSSKLQELKEDTDKRLKSTDGALLDMPLQLQNRREVVSNKKAEHDARTNQLEHQHMEIVRTMKEHQVSQVSELKTNFNACLASKAQCNAKCQKELDEFRSHQQRITAECQEEMLMLYELVGRLCKLVADIEDGKQPMVVNAGLKRVILPECSKPELPKAEKYAQLFDALAKEEQKVSDGEHSSQHLLPTGRLRRAGAGGIAAVAAAAAARNGLTEEAAWDAAQPPSGGDVATAEDQFDAAEHARTLCNAEEASDAEHLVAELSTSCLRRLCVELRGGCLERFSIGEEREAIRREALSGLEDKATCQYLKELEEQRNLERAAVADVAERGHQLRNLLRSRKNSLGTSSVGSRTVSCSNSRPASRPMSANGRISRSSSKQGGFAWHMRPPPAPVMGPNTAFA